MDALSSSGSSEAELRCPVCRAAQAWSDTCRRCKCDLGLLRAVAAASGDSRLRSLTDLRAGRFSEALRHARRTYELCPGPETARLLAVCHLLCEDWPAAMALARSEPSATVGRPK